jgi:hypothetical protein
MKRFAMLALALVAALAIAGCSKPPDTQLKQATDALAAAETAGAAKYAPDAWNTAKRALDAVKAEVASQAKKFSLIRNYRKAAALADDAIAAAKKAASTAVAQKQIATDAATAVEELTRSLQNARNRLSSLGRVRGLDVASLKTLLSNAGKKLDQARTDLAGGKFDSALAAASDGRDTVTNVLRTIEKATGKPASKKR